VRGLGLKGHRGWLKWSKSGHRPSDLPGTPSDTDRDAGWISWNDWLGSGKERVAWRCFTDGRALARGLGLDGKKGWEAYQALHSRRVWGLTRSPFALVQSGRLMFSRGRQTTRRHRRIQTPYVYNDWRYKGISDDSLTTPPRTTPMWRSSTPTSNTQKTITTCIP
jgi:hypothetical protein